MNTNNYNKNSKIQFEEGKKIACVTGASGFIASHLIKKLLDRGYQVRGTLRNCNDKRHDNLKKYFEGYGKRIEYFEAENNSEESFDKAVEGSIIVFHTSSPFLLGTKNPQSELIEPAVNGVKNVLKACYRSTTVKKVVMTSSVSAIYGYPVDPPYPQKFTEEYWNTSSSLNDGHYQFSKTLSERALWDFVEQMKEKEDQRQIDVAVINPSMVFGPPLFASRLSESVQIIHDLLLNRVFGIPNMGFGCVDVRDVAEAHILAGESLNASGRFICSKDSLWLQEISDILKKEFPKYPITRRTLKNWMMYAGVMFDRRLSIYSLRRSLDALARFDDTKIKTQLRFKYQYTLQQSIADTGKALIELGVAPNLLLK